MATFLLEIGTEELPADFVRQALPQLEERARADLAEARLGHGSLHATGTPRRLALIIDGLAAGQADRCEERKGPPAAQAFSGGQPAAAAIGFARRCGLDPAALEVRDTEKGPFVFATVREVGRPAAEVLTDLIPGWIAGLQGRRFMRWGAGEQRFSRPIRWLVALIDRQVVPVQLADADPPVAAGRHSRGHHARDRRRRVALLSRLVKGRPSMQPADRDDSSPRTARGALAELAHRRSHLSLQARDARNRHRRRVLA